MSQLDRKQKISRAFAGFDGKTAGGVLLASAVVFVVFVARGAAIPPAGGAAAVTAALLVCLIQLARMAAVLTGGASDLLEAEGFLDAVPLSLLRQEKQRVLRAIKELEFDHSLGKMSASDYEAVLSRYRLRAVEINRQLDLDKGLHPDVAALIAKVSASELEPGQGSELAAVPEVEISEPKT